MPRRYNPGFKAGPAGTVAFVPAVDGNLTDPDPFFVLIKPMRYKDRDKVDAAVFAAINENPEMSIAEMERMQSFQRIRKHIVKVVNYSCVDVMTGDELTPTNGEELVDALYATSLDECEKIAKAIDEGIRATKEAKAGFTVAADLQLS